LNHGQVTCMHVCMCVENKETCTWRGGCLFGARCERLSDGHSAVCRCEMRCTDSPGGRITSPVCGDDGKDYVNECELRQTSCINMMTISVKYNGSCGKCYTHHHHY